MEHNSQKSLVEEILELWIDLTGTDPDSKKIHFRFGDEFSLDAAREDLKEALRLDDTGLTALLMLDRFADEYFQFKEFSLCELIEDSAPALGMIEKSKRLKKLLHHEELLAALGDFRGKVSGVLDALQAQSPAYELLKDAAAVGYLRRDAFKSMETLHCYQFSQGKTTSKNLHPVKEIFLFWDIPSVIRLGLTMPDSTFLGLVKDKNELASFFVLVAKNGENLTVYTDCPEWVHPLQKDMTRWPGREMSSRIAKHHFPYHLLDVKFDYRGDAFISRGRNDGLSVIQNKLEIIGSITEIKPDETLWLIIILAMMDQTLFKQNYHLPELTYCTEVLFAKSLLAETSQALCLRSDGSKFELPVNTVDSLATDIQYTGMADEGKETVFGRANYHANAWLEEKYKDRVPQEAINGLLLSDGFQLALSSGESPKIASYEKAEIESLSYFDKITFDEVHTNLHTLSGNEFGSIQRLEENYRFLARYNEASVINKLARADFEAHKAEVCKWFRSCITKNLDRLILDLVEAWPLHEEDPEVRKRWSVWDFRHVKAGRNERGLYWFHQGDGRTWAKTLCIQTGKATSYTAELKLYTLEDLMYATGCKSIKEVPEWLRHWGNSQFYGGNPILERIDPMSWVVKDKWAEMRFHSLFFLSKTAIREACKKKGLPPSSFVPYPEED
ncbi:MAG: hypothetical protein OSJ69_17885 [Acetatifactor sp.]|nr:hypothetical protein [Acetatifactor sp.]